MATTPYWLGAASLDNSTSQDVVAESSLDFVNFWFDFGLSVAFSILAIVRCWQLLPRPSPPRRNGMFLVGKVTLGTTLVALNTTLFALTERNDGIDGAALFTYLPQMIATAFASVISVLSHLKQSRPSNLLSSYMFLSLLSGVVRVQSLWLDSAGRSAQQIMAAVSTTTTVIHLMFLLVNAKTPSHEKSEFSSPEQMSSIFSLGLYAWLNKLLWQGYKQLLVLEDLYPLDPAIASKPVASIRSHAGEDGQQHQYEPQDKSAFSILRWAVSPILRSLLIPIVPRLCLMGFTFSQPFFIHTLLSFLSRTSSSSPSENSPATANTLIAAAVLIYTGLAVSTAFYWYYQERFQSLLRARLITAIYDRTATLPSAPSSSTTLANAPQTKPTDRLAPLTLMSTDTDTLYLSTRQIHELWASHIETILASYLLHRELGNIAFLPPLAIVIFGFASSFGISRFAVKSQRDWMTYIQHRVSVTSSVLGNVIPLRISGMIAPAAELIQEARVAEIEKGGRMRGIVNLSASMSQIPSALGPVAAFAVAFAGGSGGVIDSTKAFTALSYLSLLTGPLMVVLQSLPVLVGCWACLGRVWEFVEVGDVRCDLRTVTVTNLGLGVGRGERRRERDEDDMITIKDGKLGWSENAVVLRNINLSIAHDSFTIVLGPVASGKSTLLRGLLGELPIVAGQIDVKANPDRIAYCDQTPFLLNGTIMSNIIGFSSFSQKRYNEVLHALCLDQDLKTLPNGDQTKIGSKGVSLSGGQKMRVSLARALYHDAELLILDDIFAGLDASTQALVFERVFGSKGLLRGRSVGVVLSTQATRFRRLADQVVILGHGSLTKVERQVPIDGEIDITQRGPSMNIQPTDEQKAKATQDEMLVGHSPSTNSRAPQAEVVVTPHQPTNDRTVYLHYFCSIGLFPVLIFLILVASVGFNFNFPAVWLQFWVSDTSASPTHSYTYYILIYLLLAVLAILSVFSAGSIVMTLFVRLSGTNLHSTTLSTALNASLRYLTTTDTGTILNLFSQDMTILDTQMPRMINNFAMSTTNAIGQACVIAASSGFLAVSYPIFGAILWALQKFYLPTSKRLRVLDLEAKTPLYTHFLDTLSGLPTLRAYNMFPSQIELNRQLLDDSQRPSYLLAMAQQWLLLTMNIIVAVLGVILAVLATHLRPSAGLGAGLVMLMRFGFTLSMVVNAYTGLEIALGGIGRLKKFEEETEKEGGMVDQGADSAVEEGEQEIKMDMSWPRSGRIELRHVSASYTNDPSALVLKDISLSIRAGDKVAVCGRTGSGKSSLVSLLLRILDPIHVPDSIVSSAASRQNIFTIDGIPLHKISRSALRAEHIIAISQDSVFLPDASPSTYSSSAPSSAIWANLDPWDQATREEAISALQAVGLHNTLFPINTAEAVANFPASLSAGQAQLFSLARAVLRRRVKDRYFRTEFLHQARGSQLPSLQDGGKLGGVLLLDEFTASVDVETERVMMDVLKNEFDGYTVVMVTHHVDGLLEKGWRVVRMDAGRVVDSGLND